MPQAPAGLFTREQPAKQAFSLLLRFSKVTRTAMDGIENLAWMPRPTRLSAANEQQAERSEQPKIKNKSRLIDTSPSKKRHYPSKNRAANQKTHPPGSRIVKTATTLLPFQQ